MAHPNKAEGIKGHNAKLRRMTRGYGAAGGPSQYRVARENYPKGNAAADHPEGDPGFGVDPAGATARSDRPARRAAPGNAVATYHKGGKVRHRAAGGGLSLPGSKPGKGKRKGATNISINLNHGPAPMGVSGPPIGTNPAMPLPPPMPSGGIPGAAGAGAAPPPPGAGPLGQLALQQRAAGLLPRKRGGRVKGRLFGGAAPGQMPTVGGNRIGVGNLPQTVPQGRIGVGSLPQTVPQGRIGVGNLPQTVPQGRIGVGNLPQTVSGRMYKKGGKVKHRQMGGPAAGGGSFNYGQQDMKASQQAMQKANQQRNQQAGMGKAGLLNSLMGMGKANPSGSTSGTDPSAKRGGRVHGDAKDDRRLVRSMVKGSSLKHRAKGGAILKGKGAESGEGRINRNRHMDHKLKPTIGVTG